VRFLIKILLLAYLLTGDVGVSTLVAIQVHDVNDNAPVFIRSVHNVTWYTGMATDALAVVKATDKDSGTCGRVLYFIVGGNEKGLFKIDVYSGANYVMNGHYMLLLRCNFHVRLLVATKLNQ